MKRIAAVIAAVGLFWTMVPTVAAFGPCGYNSGYYQAVVVKANTQAPVDGHLFTAAYGESTIRDLPLCTMIGGSRGSFILPANLSIPDSSDIIQVGYGRTDTHTSLGFVYTASDHNGGYATWVTWAETPQMYHEYAFSIADVGSYWRVAINDNTDNQYWSTAVTKTFSPTYQFAMGETYNPGDSLGVYDQYLTGDYAYINDIRYKYAGSYSGWVYRDGLVCVGNYAYSSGQRCGVISVTRTNDTLVLWTVP